MPSVFARTVAAVAALGFAAVVAWAATTPTRVSAAGPITPASGSLTPVSGVVTGPVATATASWIYADCATGGFSGVQTDAAGNAIIGADVTLCGEYKSKYAFAVVAFPSTVGWGLADPRSLSPYAPAGATAVRGGIEAAHATGEQGICTMRSPTERIACVRVTFPKGEPATMEPIPVDDPLVDKPVYYSDGVPTVSPSQPSGFCGSCLIIVY
jgi:hypothetical protein